VKHLGF